MYIYNINRVHPTKHVYGTYEKKFLAPGVTDPLAKMMVTFSQSTKDSPFKTSAYGTTIYYTGGDAKYQITITCEVPVSDQKYFGELTIGSDTVANFEFLKTKSKKGIFWIPPNSNLFEINTNDNIVLKMTPTGQSNKTGIITFIDAYDLGIIFDANGNRIL